MCRLMLRSLALAIFVASAPVSNAFAHCFVGARFFPANLVGDDPCVADELSLPTVAHFKNGDDPSAQETDISAEFSKRITDTFGISIAPTWTHLSPPGAPSVSGFQNLETTFKSQFLTDPADEFVMSAALVVEWGGTGAAAVGADPFSTLTPTLYVGKGFGDLPDSAGWLRAFGVTGQVGYSVPTKSSTMTADPDSGMLDIEYNAQYLVYGGSIQYSMPYLKSNIIDLDFPDFINHLIPIVEASFQTPVANTITSGTVTTGTINPGVIWVGSYFQVGLEAIIPVNRQSGTNVGVIGQLHLYLDDIFPTTIGKPLFNTATNAGRPMFGN
ncbi:MAG TPA: hypothetical protein VGJ08_14085 [Rhizomicrobium sp.]